MSAEIALLTLIVRIPLAKSLKEKRRVIQSFSKKLKVRFNVTVAETDFQDQWQRAEISVASVNTKWVELEKTMTYVLKLAENQYEMEIIEDKIERI